MQLFYWDPTAGKAQTPVLGRPRLPLLSHPGASHEAVSAWVIISDWSPAFHTDSQGLCAHLHVTLSCLQGVLGAKWLLTTHVSFSTLQAGLCCLLSKGADHMTYSLYIILALPTF